jgi:hypothetical protein
MSLAMLVILHGSALVRRVAWPWDRIVCCLPHPISSSPPLRLFCNANVSAAVALQTKRTKPSKPFGRCCCCCLSCLCRALALDRAPTSSRSVTCASLLPALDPIASLHRAFPPSSSKTVQTSFSISLSSSVVARKEHHGRRRGHWLQA